MSKVNFAYKQFIENLDLNRFSYLLQSSDGSFRKLLASFSNSFGVIIPNMQMTSTIATINSIPPYNGLGYSVSDTAKVMLGNNDAVVRVVSTGYGGMVTEVELIYVGTGGYSIASNVPTQKLTGSGNDELKINILTVNSVLVTGTILKIYESSSGKLGIRAGSAFDSDGNLITVPADVPDIINRPSDASWKWLFIQYGTRQEEQGIISVNIGNVTGTGTEFTKIFSTNKKLKITNSVLGNNGVYDVMSVASDGSLTVNASLTSESGLKFKVVSNFFPSYTPPTGEEMPFEYDSYTLSLENLGTAPTSKKFLLAQVNSANLIDMRMQYFRMVVIPEITNLDANKITSGLLALARGGVNTDLSETGGDHKFLAQNAGHSVVPRDIAASDIPVLDESKITTGVRDILYGNTVVAGLSAGNTVSFPNWVETSASVKKLQGKFLFKAGMKTLKVSCLLSVSGGGTASVSLLLDDDPEIVSSTSASPVTVTKSYDISGLTADTIHDWAVSVGQSGGSNAYMSEVLVTLEN
jgi:hypothetical protein